jgi:hypothetical protein
MSFHLSMNKIHIDIDHTSLLAYIRVILTFQINYLCDLGFIVLT